MIENPTNGSTQERGESPSLSLAYEFVKPSYDWALHRITSVEQRIDGILGLAGAITVAIPLGVAALGRVQAMPLNTIFNSQAANITGGCALATFVIAFILGIIARQWGSLYLARLGDFDKEGWLDYERNKFHREMILLAGEDLEHNIELVGTRSTLANVMCGVLVLELFLGLAWGYLTLSS